MPLTLDQMATTKKKKPLSLDEMATTKKEPLSLDAMATKPAPLPELSWSGAKQLPRMNVMLGLGEKAEPRTTVPLPKKPSPTGLVLPQPVPITTPRDIRPEPASLEPIRAIKQIVPQLVGGVEEMIGTMGSLVQWASDISPLFNTVRALKAKQLLGKLQDPTLPRIKKKNLAQQFLKEKEWLSSKAEKWADWWYEQASKGWEAPDPEVTQAKWGEKPIVKGVATISRAAPNYLAAIALSVLTKSPQTGLLFISGLSGAGAYGRQRKAGTGKQMANAVASGTAAWEYVTEKVPFDAVFKPTKHLLAKMLKIGSLEAAQEFVQGIGENFLEYFGYTAKDLDSVPAAVKEGLEHAMDGWVENVVAGAGLGVIGAGAVGRRGLPPRIAEKPPTKSVEVIIPPKAPIITPTAPKPVKPGLEAIAEKLPKPAVAPPEAIAAPPVAKVSAEAVKVPKILYHGTSKAIAIKITKEGFVPHKPDMPIPPNLVVGIEGIYLSPTEYGARKFAKTFTTEPAKTIKATVDLKKPFVIENLTNKVIEQLEQKYVWSKVKSASPQEMSRLFKEGLQKEGYDGVIIKKWQQGGMYGMKEAQVIAFESVAVKPLAKPTKLPPKAEIAAEVKPPKVLGEIDTAKFARQARIDEVMTKGEMGELEIELGPDLGTESPAFNKHIDYFSSKQLPETSKIRAIQKMIRIVNGKRLAGKITPQQANKRIQKLRQLLYRTALKEGVSVRMTKGGKVLLAVRKAGTYVPEEFSQYGKFQNIYPLGQDITRSVQQIDGSLTVKEKVKMKGQAGATERYILWPVREMSKQKLEYIKEKSARLKQVFKTKKGTKEDAQINIVLERIAKEDRSQPIKNILNAKTIKAMGVNPRVVKQAVELRKFYDDLIEEQNQARRMRNQEPIPYRHNYSPHILRDTTIWERMMMKGQKVADVIAKKADLPDYIRPNKPFNPREMAREAGIPYEKRVKSATELAESYLVTAAKDIFNTSMIQNNKAFIQQLETMGNDKAARFLGDWTAESYAGITPALDRGIKLTYLPKTQRGMRWFNRIRNLAVFPLNFSWNLLTQTSSLALTMGRYGTVNTAKGFYQWLHPSIRKQAAKDYYSYVIKSAKQGRITHQDAQNLIGESVKLRRTKGDLARDISTYFLEQLEKLLTGTSIRAAHLHGIKRGLTGEALKNYASDGGAKTQSMYNDEDKPALLRSVAVKTAAPYQTFAYEVMNTLREWAGTTGTPPDTRLYTIWTVLRFLAAATVFAAIAKKAANKDVWSWKRPPIPFAEYWLSPIVRIFSKEYMAKSASGLTSPVETAQRMAKGIDDVLETNSWRKLRNELIKYGPGVIGIPGGVQWSRTVDAIIAYSQGGVRDRRGRLLFKMEDPQDLVQAMFSGVWTTKGGREYLEKRTGKKSEQPTKPTRPKRPDRPKRPSRPTRKVLEK